MSRRLWIGLALVALLAGVARFHRLGDGALRGDELNRYLEGRSPMTLVEFWRNWESTNQIPFQNAVCIAVARWLGEVTEFTMRVPGAVAGILTVVLLAFWVGRHWGAAAGIFAGVWMALNPYHLHESREAYYYGLLMFAGAVFSLATIEMLVRMRATRRAPGGWVFAGWAGTVWLLCMTHMSTWVYAALWGAVLLACGWVTLPKTERIRHLARLAVSGVVVLFLMRRWIGDAIAEVRKVSEDSGYEYIGYRFSDVAPRVLPMYLAGVNWLGVLLLALLAAAAVLLWIRRKELPADSRYGWLTGLTLASVAAMFAYVGGVGHGVAKETFFSAFWPVLLPWGAVTLWKAAPVAAGGRLPAAAWNRVFLGAAAGLALLLAKPAWMLMNLDGKPTPYHQIRDWLDRNLPEGTVVVVDRWFEPWAEMAVYAPSNVTVTFTIPDEPFRQYVDSDWRGVTQRAFEAGEAQAFLRLVRNHEERMGEWSWPARFFKRRQTIVNERALWLRHSGYSVMSALLDANTNRTVVDVFYNTDEDWADRARAAGKDAYVQFGGGWDLLKAWRPLPGWPEQLMQSLWVQAGYFAESGQVPGSMENIYRLSEAQAMRYLSQGRWAEYRVSRSHSRLRVFNLAGREQVRELKLTGVAVTGPVRALAGGTPVSFPPSQLVTRTVPVTLQPGENTVTVSVPEGQVLLIRQAAL